MLSFTEARAHFKILILSLACNVALCRAIPCSVATAGGSMLSEVRDNARMLGRGTIERELVPKWLRLRLRLPQSTIDFVVMPQVGGRLRGPLCRLAFLDLLPVLRAAAFSAGAGCC